MIRKFAVMVTLVVWCASAAVGWAWLAHFSSTPGQQDSAPLLLPERLAALSFAGSSGSKQLFVVLHPQCSCSRATVSELSRILSHNPQAARVTVLLYQPGALPPHWKAANALAEQIEELRVAAVSDIDGRYAAALHASTSGEVILYSGDGRLLFQGGITSQRGHEGDSFGGAELSRALQGRTPVVSKTAVFGCPVLNRLSDRS